MKTNTLLITALALCLSCFSCSKSPKVVKETKTMPTAPVVLKLKWPEGRYMVQTLEIKQSSEMTVPGAPKPMKQDMTMGQDYSMSVLKAREAGKREVEMKFIGSRMMMKMEDRVLVDFDSSKKSSGATNAVADIFKQLVGTKIRLVLDASNRVESVEGTEELGSRLKSGAGGDPSGVFESMFKKDYFKQLMDFARNLPDKAVEPGDTWPMHYEIAMGSLGTMVMDYTMTFQNWEKRNDRYCARIGMDGTVKSSGEQSPNAQGMKISIEGGKSSGDTLFDLDMGMFIESTMNQDMKMNITIPNPAAASKPGTPKTLNITSLMNQVIKTKLELK